MSALSASQAYAAVSRATGQHTSSPKQDLEPQSSKTFSDLMSDTIQQTVEVGQNFDQKMQAVATGQGQTSIIDVVTAVAEAELTLETMVSVRDRVVSAYQEVMRMPI